MPTPRQAVFRTLKLVGKLTAIVLLAGFFSACLVRWAPGYGIEEQQLDIRLSNQSIQRLRQNAREDKSLFASYVGLLRGFLHGDMGTSRTLNEPVSRLLADRLPETCKSIACGLAFGWALGFFLAVLVVSYRTWYVDLLGSIVAGVLLCLPSGVLAILFVLAHAPVRLLIGCVVCPKVFRYSRNLLLRSSDSLCVVTAHAKGLSRTSILFRHIIFPVLPQLIALAGITVSMAFTASIPIEALCDLPGIGQLAWKAALGRDVPLLINLTMIAALITLTANSVSDLFRRGQGAPA